MEQGRSLRRSAFELTLTSFIVLFQELALIRWTAAQVRVLAYFPNVVLISAFLGLGIGTMRSGKRLRMWLWPASLLVLVGIMLAMHGIAFTGRNVSEYLWLLYFDIPNAPVIYDVRLPIVLAFVLTAITFLVPGQIVGERLQDFSRSRTPLGGYIADLGGSLIGVIAFALAAFYRTFPATWFAIILIAAAMLFAGRQKRALIVHVVLSVIIVGAIHKTERSTVYSPYYALRVVRSSGGKGLDVLVNGSFHQYAAPIAHTNVPTTEYDRVLQHVYPAPYAFFSGKPKRVLVLGAGNGNDVSVALDNGAERIDAVEIDPVIIDIGRSLHPDHPYRSPRVRVFNTDARAYLRNTTERYDLIVFGTLDSQTRLSALANVRLDNFVYTIDCMRMARERLAPGGGMALYFCVQNTLIHNKIFAMLTDAFGKTPIVISGFRTLFTEVFLAGPAFDRLHTPQQQALLTEAVRRAASVDVPTDDWPYLYLDSRRPSVFYISVSAMFLALAALMTALLAPELRRAPLQHFDGQMFLFGLAFLLLETKLVTQISLLWGATWITSAVVFGAILLMVLLGTLLMQIRPIPFSVAAAGLFATLLLTYLIPTGWLLARTPPARLALSILFAGSPVFFASICFALLFRRRTRQNLAFGWNLAGAVVGGLIEILAITIGLRSLTLVALVAYLIAIVLEYRTRAAERQVVVG